MDKKQIIHIASEVVVISGFAIYFQLKNNSLSKEIQDLKNDFYDQQDLIKEMKIELKRQEQLLNKLSSRLIVQEQFMGNHEKVLSSLALQEDRKTRSPIQTRLRETTTKENHIGLRSISEDSKPSVRVRENRTKNSEVKQEPPQTRIQFSKVFVVNSLFNTNLVIK